jgi:hypothetical protein
LLPSQSGPFIGWAAYCWEELLVKTTSGQLQLSSKTFGEYKIIDFSFPIGNEFNVIAY